MCKCRICIDIRRWESILDKHNFSIGEKRFIEDFLDRKHTEGLDADVDSVVLSGTWPGAVNILIDSLGKAMEHGLSKKMDVSINQW